MINQMWFEKLNKGKERNANRYSKLTKFPSAGGTVPENWLLSMLLNIILNIIARANKKNKKIKKDIILLSKWLGERKILKEHTIF